MNNAPSMSTSFFTGLKELQKRIFFAVGALIVYRIGTHIFLPGIDPEKIALLLNQTGNGLMAYFSILSGGSLSGCTVFSMGLGPYITVSILLQVLSHVIPSLEQLKKEGEAGRRKLNEYTRYGTFVIAVLHSFGYIYRVVLSGIVADPTIHFYAMGMLTLVAGSLFLMWLGEQITDRGIGQGTSLIIFAGIVAGLPRAIFQLIEQVKEGQVSGLQGVLVVTAMLALALFVVWMERAHRKITVHHPKRQQGRHLYAAQSDSLPLKVNMAGITPTIFANYFMILPNVLLSAASWLGVSEKYPILERIGLFFYPGHPLYMVVLAVVITFFSFAYTSILYNPRETADNLKKAGAFISGIRPGEQSAQYIDRIMTHLTVIGCIYLLLVVLLPDLLAMWLKMPFSLGGTSLLIVIVVVMELIGQIQSLLVSYQYGHLLKKARLKGNFPIR